MDREEIRKQMKGVVATVPTPFDENYRVDYGVMAAATERWIENGLVNGKSVLKVAAAMGEGPQIREEEWRSLLQTTVQAAKGRVPVMGAVHYKDTVRTIEDINIAADLGVIGCQVSPPIFNQPTEDDMLRFFGDISDNVDSGVLIYNTHWMSHGAIYPKTFAKMTDFEYVVAIKWSPPEGTKYEDIFELADRFNIMDNSDNPVGCHRLGGHGYLTDGVDSYPAFYLGIWDLMEEGKYDEAQAQWDRVIPDLREFYRKVTQVSGGEARVEKGLSEVMGIPVGPPRPPSLPLSTDDLAELRALMIGWGWPVPDADYAK
jgi:4-hydroxy-tetrahydrodipicolinate synthase